MCSWRSGQAHPAWELSQGKHLPMLIVIMFKRFVEQVFEMMRPILELFAHLFEGIAFAKGCFLHHAIILPCATDNISVGSLRTAYEPAT